MDMILKMRQCVRDEAITGSKVPDIRGKGGRKVTISANISMTQVKVVICGILLYGNVCFSS